MRGSARPHLNYKRIIGCQCQQEAGKIPRYTDSEQWMTPKTDYLLTVCHFLLMVDLISENALATLQRKLTKLLRDGSIYRDAVH